MSLFDSRRLCEAESFIAIERSHPAMKAKGAVLLLVLAQTASAAFGNIVSLRMQALEKQIRTLTQVVETLKPALSGFSSAKSRRTGWTCPDTFRSEYTDVLVCTNTTTLETRYLWYGVCDVENGKSQETVQELACVYDPTLEPEVIDVHNLTCAEHDGLTAEGSDRCFFVPEGKIGTWEESTKACEDLGAILASVHNAAENKIVHQLWMRSGAHADHVAWGGLWLGGTDSEDFSTEGSFVWSDGTDFSEFQDWTVVDNKQQPNNWLEQDCLSYGYLYGGATWNDRYSQPAVEGWVDNDCLGVKQAPVCVALAHP